MYIYIICGYQTSRHQAIWHKTLLGKRLPCLVDVVYQCIVVLSVTLVHFLGDWVSMHSYEADWTITDGYYGQARLKEVFNVPPCINYGPHMWSFCYGMCKNGCEIIMAGCERLTACLQSTCRVHMRALQSEGKIIPIYSYSEIRVYFYSFYDMALGFKSLCLVVVLFKS